MFLEPDRVREVVQCDHRLDPASAQSSEHLAVAHQRAVIPLTRRRLDAAPFEREAQRVQPHLRGGVEVALGVVPPVAGAPAGFAGLDVSRALPRVPLVVGIAALILMR